MKLILNDRTEIQIQAAVPARDEDLELALASLAASSTFSAAPRKPSACASCASLSTACTSLSAAICSLSGFSLWDSTTALEVKAIYRTWEELAWEGFTAKEAGYKFTYADSLYKTAQGNVTFQPQYAPGEGTESLYARIDEAHAGTLDDPIPAYAAHDADRATNA